MYGRMYLPDLPSPRLSGASMPITLDGRVITACLAPQDTPHATSSRSWRGEFQGCLSDPCHDKFNPRLAQATQGACRCHPQQRYYFLCWRRCSYKHSAVAMATFRDSTPGAWGMNKRWLALASKAGLTPCPSLPNTHIACAGKADSYRS